MSETMAIDRYSLNLIWLFSEEFAEAHQPWVELWLNLSPRHTGTGLFRDLFFSIIWFLLHGCIYYAFCFQVHSVVIICLLVLQRSINSRRWSRRIVELCIKIQVHNRHSVTRHLRHNWWHVYLNIQICDRCMIQVTFLPQIYCSVALIVSSFNTPIDNY